MTVQQIDKAKAIGAGSVESNLTDILGICKMVTTYADTRTEADKSGIFQDILYLSHPDKFSRLATQDETWESQIQSQ